MGVIAWTWLIVAASFVLYFGIALWSKARSAADYYVVDRSVNPVLNGMATGTDWMSAASFMSMAGLMAVMGRDGSVYLMGWTGGYVLLAVLLAPYLRKYGKYTVPSSSATGTTTRPPGWSPSSAPSRSPSPTSPASCAGWGSRAADHAQPGG